MNHHVQTPLFLLLLIPAAVCVWRLLARRRTRAFPLPSPVPRSAARSGRTVVYSRTWRTVLAGALPLLFGAALLLQIVALARPQSGFTRRRRRVDALAIEMVVDVSGSMSALDLSVDSPTGMVYRTRLDAVKETFAAFAARRPDDLIGLITFGGYVTTHCPLTLDHDALIHALQGVDVPRSAPDEGVFVDREELLTALGDALAAACARLAAAEPRTRIVVLLTDGVSNAGAIAPADAEAVAKRLGVRVYTIGVGSSGRAPFWSVDAFGRRTLEYARVEFDRSLLEGIAAATGGRYFGVTDLAGLEAALADIDTLETTEVETLAVEVREERYRLFLLPALALTALSVTAGMYLRRSPA